MRISAPLPAYSLYRQLYAAAGTVNVLAERSAAEIVKSEECMGSARSIEGLRNLQKLSLYQTAVGNAFVEELVRKRPDLEVAASGRNYE